MPRRRAGSRRWRRARWIIVQEEQKNLLRMQITADFIARETQVLMHLSLLNRA